MKDYVQALAATYILMTTGNKRQKDLLDCVNKSSVIRQKGESQNECFKKAKHAKISQKQTFLTS